MTMFSNGPGVYVNESLSSNFVRSRVTGPVAAFFGTASRGPDTPFYVSDWTSYKRTFGDLSDQYDLGYALYHFFSNGGRNAYVTRVFPSGTGPASAPGTLTPVAASVTVPYFPNGGGNASATFFTASALSPGYWGNDLQVKVENGLTSTTFTVIVYYPNGTTEVERWPEVSLDPDSSRYIDTIVNTYSNYIRLTAVASADPTSGFGGTFTVASTSLTGGAEGEFPKTSDWTEAFDKIDSINGDMLWNAVGLTPADNSSSLASLSAKAAARGNALVIVDCEKGLTGQANDISTAASNLSSLSNAGYVAHYAPCLRMIDPAKRGPGAIRVTYPGGAVAGVMSRFQVQRTVAAAPAGFRAEVNGALGLEAVLSNQTIGSLYESTTVPINSFKAVPGAGVVIFGARTLAKTSPDKYIPVRRTLNYLKHQLQTLTEFAVFEPNDANLWLRVNAVLSGFLTDFYQRGGLKGDNAAQAYYVICDGTNNTASSIDQGYLNVDVGVSLLYPAEYIVINLSQWTGGSNAVDNL